MPRTPSIRAMLKAAPPARRAVLLRYLKQEAE